MLKKIAIIRNKVKLHKRSVFLCIWNMVLCALIIPCVLFMCAVALFEGNPPEAFQYGLFVVCFVMIGRCWYVCYLRKWAHSYMIDYTKQILDPTISFCPRCYSPIKEGYQEYTYQQQIGEKITTVYYSDGSSSQIREPVMSKEKETLPHLFCKERYCRLGAKTQKNSAHSMQVRSQLKNNYSFYEMPKTLNKTFRLIAGDRADKREKSMVSEMCHGGYRLACVLLAIILLIASERNIWTSYDNIFMSTKVVFFYWMMIVLLSIAFIVFTLFVRIGTNSIMNSEKFLAEVKYYKGLEYDIYLTKHLASAMRNKRKREQKKLRQAMPTAQKNSGLRLSPKQWEKRKEAYRVALNELVSKTLINKGYSVTPSFYCQCYIIHAGSTEGATNSCDFFIAKDTCFLRGVSKFNFRAHQSYIESVVDQVLQNENYNNLSFSVDKDLLCIRVSYGYLASSTFNIAELDTTNVEQTISTFLDAVDAIQKRTSSNVLAKVQPELGVIRGTVWNGFTLE